MSYKIKEAKDNWESLIRDVEKGEPQIIQRGGRDIAVIVSFEEWQRLKLKIADQLADKDRKPLITAGPTA